jgi:hypothetical protein
MPYINFLEFFGNFRGDFTAGQERKNKEFAHIPFFNRLMPVEGS